MEVKYTITARYHQVDPVHHSPHKGVDVAIPMDTPIHAVHDGKVVHVLHEGSKSFGNSVWIEDKSKLTYIYGHLDKVKVKEGGVIHKGDVIGLSGNSGHSTGPHIHLQVNHPHHWWDIFNRDDGTLDPTSYVPALFQSGDSFSYFSFLWEVVVTGFCLFTLWKWMKKVWTA